MSSHNAMKYLTSLRISSSVSTRHPSLTRTLAMIGDTLPVPFGASGDGVRLTFGVCGSVKLTRR